MDLKEMYERYLTAPLLAGETITPLIVVVSGEDAYAVGPRNLPFSTNEKAHWMFFLMNLGRSFARDTHLSEQKIEALFLAVKREGCVLVDQITPFSGGRQILLQRMSIEVLGTGAIRDLIVGPIEELGEEKEPIRLNEAFAFYTGVASATRISEEQLGRMMRRAREVGEA